MNSSVALARTDSLEYLNKCIAVCKKTVCQSESDVKNGCNQMYSCSHACQIRHLGENEAQCRSHCQRNGQSGCAPEVNCYQFDLCRDCSREGCYGRPTVAEFATGCASYGKIYHRSCFCLSTLLIDFICKVNTYTILSIHRRFIHGELIMYCCNKNDHLRRKNKKHYKNYHSDARARWYVSHSDLGFSTFLSLTNLRQN